MKWKWLLCVGMSSLLFVPVSWAYEEGPVTNGGTISGAVFLKGKKPPAKAYNLVLFPETAYCGRISTGTGWRLLDEFQMGKDGALQNAVVMLEGVKKGKPFPSMEVTVQAEDCTFNPGVVVVRDRQDMSIVNMDPIIHDVQVYEVSPSGSEVIFHRPLRLNPYHPREIAATHDHRPGEPLTDRLNFTKGRRIFFLECGFHAYMQTWGIAVENPYYAITNEKGEFSLDDVPPGVYSIIVWHPGLRGILSSEVVVSKGEQVKTRFEFDSPRPRLNAETTMVENPHYSIGVLGTFGEEVEIVPTHQIQHDK